MNLEEEIQINQFGQGVRSLTDMLDQFSALESEEQRHRFILLYCELNDYPFSNTAIDQALADLLPDDAGAMYSYLRLNRFTTGRSGMVFIPSSDEPPNGRLDLAYQVLLKLFKHSYQQQLPIKKENPTAWQYRDLSDPEVVQNLLTRHQQVVEQVYADPNYRSEFVCLAKSRRADELRCQTPDPGPIDTSQTQFNFLTYDELLTNTIAPFGTMLGLVRLRESLGNALAKQYSLSTDQVNRLIVDVINRHLLET